MSTDRSQESPRYITRSYKRLQLGVSTSTSEPSMRWIMNERREPQQAHPESPVQCVLRLPELLSIIFGHLAADSDLDAIKNVRLVCKLWKQEAFSALKRNLSLMPYITVDNPNLASDLSVAYECQRSLQVSSKSLMPGCRLPLQLVVNEWTPELESFIRDFSREIVSFCISGYEQLYGFPEDLELPAMKHVKFSSKKITNNEERLVEFAKAMTFWNKFLRACKRLDTCKFKLEICEFSPLTPDNATFEQVEWRQVKRLKCRFKFFVEVNAANNLSALQNLHLYYSKKESENEANLVKQISFKKVLNLTKLKLENFNRFGHANCLLDHQMKELKYLWLYGISLSGRQPLSGLLPNLEEVFLYERQWDSRLLASLTSGGGVFRKTVRLSLFERCMDWEERIVDVADQICESFPNLTELMWISNNYNGAPVGQDIVGDNNNALLAAPVIFSKLEFLTTLELQVRLPSQREVVELLAGISLENIPENEDSWPTALEGNTRSICNLKNLKDFNVSAVEARVRLHSRHTRFLFNAAFRTMDTLEKLHFGKIILGSRSCVTEWLEMGRETNRSCVMYPTD